MTDPTSDDVLPLDRWAVPLDEPVADTPPAPPPTPDDPPAEVFRFPLDADVPGEGFQPRLLRFGKAG